jgi:hypothetical protein
LFLALIDALLEHVKLNSRMDIRDRIAALALIDRVLARDKDDEPDRAGSKVRQYATSFQAANTGGRAAADPRQGAKPKLDDERGDDDGDEGDDRETPERVRSAS